METILIPDNTSKVIAVGSRKNDKNFIINYTSLRRTSFEVGKINVINMFDSLNVNSIYTGTSCGLTITGTLSSSTIYITITTDNSGGRTEFGYEIIK